MIAGETAISTVTEGLRYRGYPVTELAEKATFDEVAYLLLHGELPTARQLADFQTRVAGRPPDPRAAARPAQGPARRHDRRWTRVRTAVSVLAHFDPDRGRFAATPTSARPSGCSARSRWPSPSSTSSARALPVIAPAPDLGHAANFLYMLRGQEPSAGRRQGARRVADPVRRARVQRLDVHRPRRRLDRVRPALRHRRRHRRLEGPAARRRQREGDGPAARPPAARRRRRSGCATRWPARRRSWASATASTRPATCGPASCKSTPRGRGSRGQRCSGRRRPRSSSGFWATEKNLYPNLDWPAGRLYHALGLEVPLYTPIFVMSRVAGWAAHVIEQHEHNRLIRPRGLYTGPDRRSVGPINERGG